VRKFLALGLLFMGVAAHATNYDVQLLQGLSPGAAGSSGSLAYGLNESGQVVGRSYNSATGVQEAVIWDNGIIASFGVEGIARAVNNNGTVVGTTTFSTDVAAAINSRSTKSFSFNGTTHIALPQAGIDFADRAQSTGASLSMWIKAAAQDTKTLFNEGNSVDQTPSDPVYNFQSGEADDSTDDQLRLFYRGSNASTPTFLNTSSGSVFDSEWHHLLLTDNNGTVTLYIDGAFDSNMAYTPLGTGQFDVSALGSLLRFNVALQYTGLMDEVAFYDEVLDLSDAQALAGGADPTNVPEPTSSSLALIGLGGLMLARRRRG